MFFTLTEDFRTEVTLRAPVFPMQQTPNFALWGILDGWIRATKCPNATDPQVLYNPEI